MQISEIIRLVFLNILQNKFKVFLTSLGIIVGTATIVMVMAIGAGGTKDVEEQFKTLNAGTITVTASSQSMMDMMGMMGGGMPEMSGMPDMAGGGERSSGGSMSASGSSGGGMSSGGGKSGATALSGMETSQITEEQLEDILFFVPDIVTGAISATADMDVYGGELEEALNYQIVGTEESYAQISNLTLSIGTFITEDEVENTTRSVVLGYNVALEIFGSIYDAYDSMIEIDGREYVVNGVLNQIGTVVSGINPDDSVFMPYSTAEKYIFERDFTPQLSILAADVEAVEAVMANIELVLTDGNSGAVYSITDAGATMDAAMESANTLSLLLLAVAVIVFIVGGIGIMNVLFVSVKERTKEIGVLKALGTKKFDILQMFLMEASMIGFLGGVIGVAVSYGLIPLMEYTEITVVYTSSAVVLALGFAMITGTVFGLYPAWKASNLLPIAALNNE